MDRKSDPLIRKSLSLPTSVWREIEEFRQAERIPIEAEATRRLIVDALRLRGAVQTKGAVRAEAFAEAAAMLDMSSQTIRLHVGEMTAGEMRAVKAVLKWKKSEIGGKADGR